MPEPDLLALFARLLQPPFPADLLPESVASLLIQKGAILSLAKISDPENVAILQETVRGTASQEIKELALWALGELASTLPVQVADGLFNLAVLHQETGAALLLDEKRLLRPDSDQMVIFALFYAGSQQVLALDPELRQLSKFTFQSVDREMQAVILKQARRAGFSHWAQMAEAILTLQTAQLNQLAENFPSYTPSEKSLCLSLLRSTAGQNRVAQNILCQLFIQHDHLPAKNIALEAGFLPESTLQTALFYFLAEQWEEYQKVDFDHSYLTTAYEISTPAVQNRLIRVSRKSGQLEWTRRLSASSRRIWLGDLNDADWQAVINLLSSTSQWPELWLLAQAGPPANAAQIFTLLTNASWKAQDLEEQAALAKFAALAAVCQKAGLPVSPQASWRSPSQEVTCLTDETLSGILAAGTSQTAIHLWKLTTSVEAHPPIFSPIARTHALAISPTGTYLAAALGDNTIRLYDLSDGRMVKTLGGHQGLIRTLAFAPDGKILYSASFDQTVMFWRIPQGSPLPPGKIKFDNEVFGLEISPDGRFLLAAGAGKTVQVFRLPEGKLIYTLSSHAETITALSASPFNHLAASCSRDRHIQVFNYASGRIIHSLQALVPLSFICFAASGRHLFEGSLDGKIMLVETSTGKRSTLPEHHQAVITGLRLVKDGHGLVSASQDGRLCWWDLRLWNLIQSPVETILQQSTRLKELSARTDRSLAEDAWAKLALSMLEWRTRHDIQIGDTPEFLHAGEFDIEL
jgi:hypothetical protein